MIQIFQGEVAVTARAVRACCHVSIHQYPSLCNAILSICPSLYIPMCICVYKYVHMGISVQIRITGNLFTVYIYIYIYVYTEVKLTFEMLTVRGQQHSFSTHERVFLWKCQSYWDRKCVDLRGTRTPNLRIHDECSNLLSYQGQTFAVLCFEHWLWWYRYFWELTFEILTVRGQQHQFSIVFVKVSKFLRQKMSRPEGDSNPQIYIYKYI